MLRSSHQKRAQNAHKSTSISSHSRTQHTSRKTKAPHTIPNRKMAVWRNGKIIKWPKLKGVDMPTLLGQKKAEPPKYGIPPATQTFKAVPHRLPTKYIGYHSHHRFNEMIVEPNPAQVKYTNKVDGSGSRFQHIAYNRKQVDKFVIKAYPRRTGPGVSADLRSRGFIPASVQHVSNGKNMHMNFYLDPIKLERYKTMRASWSMEWHLEVEGMQETIRCFLRDWQIDPVTRRTGSLRFLEASPTHHIKVHVPLEYEGDTDNLATRKGAVLIHPSTHIRAFFNPCLANRVGTGPMIEVSTEMHDRDLNHTLRTEDVPIPFWMHVPKTEKWGKHVLYTFTKQLG